jgi:hypothetical protein
MNYVSRSSEYESIQVPRPSDAEGTSTMETVRTLKQPKCQPKFMVLAVCIGVVFVVLGILVFMLKSEPEEKHYSGEYPLLTTNFTIKLFKFKVSNFDEK